MEVTMVDSDEQDDAERCLGINLRSTNAHPTHSHNSPPQLRRTSLTVLPYNFDAGPPLSALRHTNLASADSIHQYLQTLYQQQSQPDHDRCSPFRCWCGGKGVWRRENGERTTKKSSETNRGFRDSETS